MFLTDPLLAQRLILIFFIAVFATACVTPSDSSKEGDPPAGIPSEPIQIIDEEKIILDANKHVEKNELFEAIQLFKKIPTVSAQFSYARFRISTLTERAVQDLRSRAANAFTAAGQAQTKEEKLKFFDLSESLLMQAKEKYPESEKMSVIDSNLAVIQSEKAKVP